MMLGLGIDTIAFEPLPANLFYLTSAVLANKPAFRAHLTLHPIALGAASGTIPLYSQRGNAGNTVVNAPVGDSQADEAAMVHAGAVAQILVSTLDSQMWPDSTAPAPRIALLKMDVQGYECRLLAGAQRLLAARAIQTVKLEVAPRWLRKQGCSAMELYTKLRGAGFHLWMKPGSQAEVLTTSSVGAGPPTHAYRLRATAAETSVVWTPQCATLLGDAGLCRDAAACGCQGCWCQEPGPGEGIRTSSSPGKAAAVGKADGPLEVHIL